MGKLVSVATAVYIFVCIIVFPASIIKLWDLIFDPVFSASKANTLINYTIVLTLGLALIAILVKARRLRIDALIGSIRPTHFETTLEVYGLHDIAYFAVSTRSDQLLIVDVNRGIALCEPTIFMQTWWIERERSETVLTISFNSLDCSTLRLTIPHKLSADIASKLNYLL